MTGEPSTAPEGHGPRGTDGVGRRTLYVLYVFAMAAAVIGLYVGMRYDPIEVEPEWGSSHAAELRGGQAGAAAAGVRPATAYADIRRGSFGPNAGWKTELPLPPTPNEQWGLVRVGSEHDKLEDLAARAKRRAYNGAPPTIPHRIDSLEVASCEACHGPRGLVVGDVIAPPMPHESYASCTQCHVPERAELDAGSAEEERPWSGNRFAGLPAPTSGSRAGVGAPPTIPHATGMRPNCLACHGPLGANGLQSSHPWRSSCTQCHAPSATLDLPPGGEPESPAFLPFPVPR